LDTDYWRVPSGNALIRLRMALTGQETEACLRILVGACSA